MAHVLWHWAPRGWLLGQCLSVADYVRGPEDHPRDDRRRSGLMLPALYWLEQAEVELSGLT